MNFTALKEFMDRLSAWRVPGNSISVYYKNKEVFRYSSGYSDLENRIPMNGSELLNIYSCSKVATVTAALQLYEKGLFLLDDPVYEFIPEFRRMTVNNGGVITEAKNPITMRHLFTMTAGLSYNTESENIRNGIARTNGRLPTVEAARCIAKDALLFEPGKRWNYSLCHDVLGAVIEVISGQAFGEYVKKNIFEPIGVTDIYYHRDEDVKARMAQQYEYRPDGELIEDFVDAQINAKSGSGKCVNVGKEVSLELGSEYDSGGAGITVSVPDYARFADALANGGKAANGEVILSAGTIELLRTPQLNQQQIKTFNWKQLSGYNYGLGVRTAENRALIGFNGIKGEFGWGGAAGATILCDPDSGLSYFYSHHMLNPQEEYYQPRLRNVVFACMGK